MPCPHCQSQKVVENGKYRLKDGREIHHLMCKECGKRFSDKAGTPMACRRTPVKTVSVALKMRGEGMGARCLPELVNARGVSTRALEQRC